MKRDELIEKAKVFQDEYDCNYNWWLSRHGIAVFVADFLEHLNIEKLQEYKSQVAGLEDKLEKYATSSFFDNSDIDMKQL
jgi:hypothetical protein